MVRVLHYLSGLADIKAGVETYIVNLYSFLSKDEFEFSILTRNAKSGSMLNELLKNSGIKIYEIPIPTLNVVSMFQYRKELNTFFKAHQGDFDFLHMHGCDDPFVIQEAKRYGIDATAIHVHSLSRENKNAIKNTIKGFTAKANIRNANFRFACSELAGKSLFPDNKFEVIKNTIDTEKFAFDPDKRNVFREQFGLCNDQLVICFCGRFSDIKNIPFLLQIFRDLTLLNSSVRLFLIGDGEKKNELVENVKMLNIQDRVVFTGEVEDVSGILSAMDLYLQTSFKEGFSISALEAQCSGLTTILTNGFPDDVILTDLVISKSLNDESGEWAQLINKLILHKDRERKHYADIIKAAGYDTEQSAIYMSGVYKNAKND